jgi:hypothetical protein
MSKDMLGSVIRSAVGVPQDRLDVLAKIASAMGASAPGGATMHEYLRRLLENGVPYGMPTPLFSVIATTNLDALGEKKTKDCFPKPRYVYRDNNFGNWLSANQPKTDACVIATLALTKGWMFAEAAVRVLGVGAGTSIKLLGKALIENGHTMTLSQAEEMVEATERGEKTGMRTDGYGNFFFVETGNEDNPVSVGCVDRGGGGWHARVDSLDDGNRWCAVTRLLVRNLDASKL